MSKVKIIHPSDPELTKHLDKEAKTTVECGILYRGLIRQSAAKLGLAYEEHKGFLTSVFVLRGKVRNLRILTNYLRENHASD